ncbi:MAG TPA: hypothetical protein VFF69_14550 [Phycisphaerales bacterium]|nr:hypothetical protein [Phycisphaerales bacterium]
MDFDGYSRAFVWDGGVHIPPTLVTSGGGGINEAGVPVGRVRSGLAIWNNGRPAILSPLMGAAQDIADSGAVVGSARFDGQRYHPPS